MLISLCMCNNSPILDLHFLHCVECLQDKCSGKFGCIDGNRLGVVNVKVFENGICHFVA